MREFAELYAALDETTKINPKVAAMARYFATAPAEDAAWAVHFLVGRRPRRLVSSPKLQAWAAERAGLPTWLFGECYDAVGDLAETMAHILPEGDGSDRGLAYWVIDRLLPLDRLEEAEQKSAMLSAWAELSKAEIFVWNKLITGSFRVGVSQELVNRALAQVTGLPTTTIAHRLMGEWSPTAEFFRTLFDAESVEQDLSRPYPFALAHPLTEGPESLGELTDWAVEWKWDGIRSQVIRRGGQTFIWSRGEELITDRFPEVAMMADQLPDGTVLDGEILAWVGGRPLKFMELQKRIGRKILTKKILQDVPVVLVAFDLLELDGEDIRGLTMAERRSQLESLIQSFQLQKPLGFIEEEVPTSELGMPRRAGSLMIAPHLTVSSWEELAHLRERAREFNVEGFMLKRSDALYQGGRRRGLWWKWKIDPLTVDAVLVYAQRGSGRRASLYTDYTFALWDEEGKLVPFAKAYSGLTDEEIRKVDRFVRAHTKEKFGPVRTVEPELVMELAFEGIQVSSRHKSGIAVRFPRILRWRHDKKPQDADRVEAVRQMLES